MVIKDPSALTRNKDKDKEEEEAEAKAEAEAEEMAADRMVLSLETVIIVEKEDTRNTAAFPSKEVNPQPHQIIQMQRNKMNKLHLNPPQKKQVMKQSNCGLPLATIFLVVQNVLVN